MWVLIYEAACMLYDFLCLYDPILVFWPNHDAVVEFAAPKGLCNRSRSLPSSRLLVFVLEDIRIFSCPIRAGWSISFNLSFKVSRQKWLFL